MVVLKAGVLEHPYAFIRVPVDEAIERDLSPQSSHQWMMAFEDQDERTGVDAKKFPPVPDDENDERFPRA